MSDHISNRVSKADLTVKEIHELNQYHYDPRKNSRFAAIREACDTLMQVILENCDCCADRTHALQQVRLTRMWANSAIALEAVVPIPEGHCELCGKPMPKGEEMFRYHGNSGPCPKD